MAYSSYEVSMAAPDTEPTYWFVTLRSSCHRWRITWLVSCSTFCLWLTIPNNSGLFGFTALNGTNFLANQYSYVAVTGLTEVPSYIVPCIMFKFMGRKMVSLTLFLFAGLALLSVLLIPRGKHIVQTTSEYCKFSQHIYRELGHHHRRRAIRSHLYQRRVCRRHSAHGRIVPHQFAQFGHRHELDDGARRLHIGAVHCRPVGPGALVHSDHDLWCDRHYGGSDGAAVARNGEDGPGRGGGHRIGVYTISVYIDQLY